MKTLLDEELKDKQFKKMFTIEGYFLEVTEKIWEIIQNKKISMEELSKRTGKNVRELKSFLNYHSNISIKELFEILYALESDITFEFEGNKK